MVYSQHSVRDLVKQYLFDDYSKNAVITGMGFNFLFFQDSSVLYTPISISGDISLLVVGVSTVAYKREFFKDDIFLLTDNLPLSCFLSDDFMISAYLLANKINIIKASGVSYNPVLILLNKELPSSYTKDALQYGANHKGTGGNESNYVDCFAFLSKHNKINYKDAIMARSEAILNKPRGKLLYSRMVYFYYRYYLLGMIRVIPFLETIIINTMN